MNGSGTENCRTQVFLVHGGMTFKSRDGYLNYLRTKEVTLEKMDRWSGEWFREQLGDKCDIISPRMPCQDFAQYEEWKLLFERYILLLDDDHILIGSSLGGVFLAKYLSENEYPKRLLSVYLVCPPFDDSLSTEELAGGFVLGDDLSLIKRNCGDTTLLFSQDDPVVPVQHAQKYGKKLPESTIIIFEGKNGHFLISEFPELVAMIREDISSLPSR